MRNPLPARSRSVSPAGFEGDGVSSRLRASTKPDMSQSWSPQKTNLRSLRTLVFVGGAVVLGLLVSFSVLSSTWQTLQPQRSAADSRSNSSGADSGNNTLASAGSNPLDTGLDSNTSDAGVASNPVDASAGKNPFEASSRPFFKERVYKNLFYLKTHKTGSTTVAHALKSYCEYVLP